MYNIREVQAERYHTSNLLGKHKMFMIVQCQLSMLWGEKIVIREEDGSMKSVWKVDEKGKKLSRK